MVTPDDFVCIPISKSLFERINENYRGRVGQLIERLIMDQEEILSPVKSSNNDEGITYFNKSVWNRSIYLPNGTQIKANHHGTIKICTVKNGAVKVDGKPTSSLSDIGSRLKGGTSVSGWRDIEVRRPGDIKWRSPNRISYLEKRKLLVK